MAARRSGHRADATSDETTHARNTTLIRTTIASLVLLLAVAACGAGSDQPTAIPVATSSSPPTIATFAPATPSGPATTPQSPAPSSSTTGTSTPAPSTSTETDRSTGEPTKSTPAANPAVSIDDFAFVPDMVTVAAGTTVTWTNLDASTHTVTAGTESAPEPDLFDLDISGTDAQVTATLADPGTYAYFCRVHPFMTATIEVIEPS